MRALVVAIVLVIALFGMYVLLSPPLPTGSSSGGSGASGDMPSMPKYVSVSIPGKPRREPFVAPTGPAPSLPASYELPSPYMDTACKCVPNPAAIKQLDAQRAPVRAFLKWIDSYANAIVSARASEAPLVDGIGKQVSAGALSAGKVNKQGKFERIPTTMQVAACLARLSTPMPPACAQWLKAIAADTSATFGATGNNQQCWSVCTKAIVAVATRDQALYAGAQGDWDAIMASQVSDDGTMPAELKRGSRATNYHEYACDALVTAGYWLRRDHPRVHALVGYVLSQDRTKMQNRLAWLALYERQHGLSRLKNADKAQAELAALAANPRYNSTLGGPVAWQLF